MSHSQQFPSFYVAEKVGDLYKSRDEQITAVAAEYARKNGIKPAHEDQLKIAFFGIDIQIDFALPLGSLFVPGAVEDSTRTIEFIYRNLSKLTSLHFSLDTHKIFQIFHPIFWIDNETGTYPAPFTLITSKLIRSGRFTPALFPQECIEYCEELEKTGRYVLCIWPFHTLLGSVGHAMVPSVFEAATFHAVARHSQTHFETKGIHPLTENYSVLEPEVKKVRGRVVGQFNTKFFKTLMEHDRVYVAGQASSHCAKTTIESLLQKIKDTDSSLVEKVYILEDCMSPVPALLDENGGVLVDFPAIAQSALDDFRAAGMNVVKSTDVIDLVA